MKLIHFTARRFQYFTADSIYVENIARQFYEKLRDDYYLVLAGELPDQFKGINRTNLKIFSFNNIKFFQFWLPLIIYFFWTPFFITTKKFYKEDCMFFSNDPNLLCLLIILKKIFPFHYSICSDWHLLYDNWKDNFISNNSQKMITTSEKLKSLIISKYNIAPEKILTVYGAVDIDKIRMADKKEARQSLGLPINKKLIGYIGLFKTMGMEKGIRTMLAALPYLNEEINMVFAGGQPGEIEEYKKIAEKLKVADRCIFSGRKKFAEVVLYEQAADILVIPYPDKPHFRLYGFPMKVYEYMAANRPIIYSRLELTEEVLSDCGFTFTPDDSADLAKTIKYVLANPDDAEKKTKIAAVKLKDFTWAKKAERIIDYLKSNK